MARTTLFTAAALATVALVAGACTPVTFEGYISLLFFSTFFGGLQQIPEVGARAAINRSPR